MLDTGLIHGVGIDQLPSCFVLTVSDIRTEASMVLHHHHDDTYCTFCNEFIGSDNCNFRQLFRPEELATRIVRRSANFVALPGLGPIGDAYLLILPLAPFACMATLPESMSDELELFTREICAAMSKLYMPPVVFEHGPVVHAQIGAGCCVEHAHLHLVSTSEEILAELQDESRTGVFGLREGYHAHQISQISELRSWIENDVGYIYYQTAAGERWGFPITEPIPSQYLRRKLGEHLGLAFSEWDWLLFPRKEQVQATWERINRYFSESV